ncbi:MAG TPA: DUF1616 domain-containing protein [Thermomicrobiales bacterium]
MNRKAAAPALAFSCFAVLVGSLSLAYGWRAAWIIMAAPLVLALPGAALTGALFPRPVLTPAEQCLFSLGLSLGVVVLAGLVLNETPWGMRAVPWIVALGAIAIIAGLVAWLRRRSAITTPAATTEGLSFAQAAICGLAVLVVLGAGFITVRGAQRQTTTGFTQLWMLPTTADATTLNIGVTNREPAETTTYRLEFEADRRVIAAWDVRLASGATWTESVTLAADISSTTMVEAVLYRADNAQTVYRRAKIQRGQ